jgi:hypothetical protein
MRYQFQFLSDEDFAKLDGKGRVAYLVRAHQELADRQRVLREQTRRTVRADQDATVPISPRTEPSGREKRGQA